MSEGPPYPCRGCGKPYSLHDPKQFDIHPRTCSECRKHYCVEHAMDRRDPKHPLYCVPGEW